MLYKWSNVAIQKQSWILSLDIQNKALKKAINNENICKSIVWFEKHEIVINKSEINLKKYIVSNPGYRII